MGVTIQQLNDKYKVEDQCWDFSLFPAWLKKHGISDTAESPIVKLTLEQVLIEFTPETLPDKHHDFDREVLRMAQANMKEIVDAVSKVLESSVQDSLKKYDSDWYAKGKMKKVWEVLRGKD